MGLENLSRVSIGREEGRGVEIEVSSRLIRASLPPMSPPPMSSLCVELLLISRATVKVAVTPIVRYSVPPSVFVRLSRLSPCGRRAYHMSNRYLCVAAAAAAPPPSWVQLCSGAVATVASQSLKLRCTADGSDWVGATWRPERTTLAVLGTRESV